MSTQGPETFSHNGLTIEFLHIGAGRETILAFHGFGRHAKDFLIFEELLLPGQQIISFNLFAHGGSIFPAERLEQQPLTKTEWFDFLSALLTNLDIDKFHMLGYSMGARVCLATIETMSNRIEEVLLLAPDGLKYNLLYRFASCTAIGRAIYRSIIDNPRWLFNLAWLLNKLKILNNKHHRFVHVHLDTREKRILVHDTWLIYKRMFPDLRRTAQKMKENGIRMSLIFGVYDSVIPPKLARRLTEKAEEKTSLHLIRAGHRLVTPETASFIREKKIWPCNQPHKPSKRY